MQVTAKSNIQHDGQLYTAGQTLEVNEKQAADLLAAGSIQPVKGLSPTEPEEAPDRSIDTPEDKNAITANTAEVANLPISIKMKKTVLIGIARANGLEVEKTATPSEVFNIIKEFRAKNQIVVDATKPEKTEDVKVEKATDEEVKAKEEAEADKEAETTTGGAEETPDAK